MEHNEALYEQNLRHAFNNGNPLVIAYISHLQRKSAGNVIRTVGYEADDPEHEVDISGLVVYSNVKYEDKQIIVHTILEILRPDGTDFYTPNTDTWHNFSVVTSWEMTSYKEIFCGKVKIHAPKIGINNPGVNTYRYKFKFFSACVDHTLHLLFESVSYCQNSPGFVFLPRSHRGIPLATKQKTNRSRIVPCIPNFIGARLPTLRLQIDSTQMTIRDFTSEWKTVTVKLWPLHHLPIVTKKCRKDHTSNSLDEECKSFQPSKKRKLCE